MCNSSLANFSLGGEEKSLYEFEGRDMKGASGKDAWSLSLPKRVTKTNYDENEDYRKAMSNENDCPVAQSGEDFKGETPPRAEPRESGRDPT